MSETVSGYHVWEVAGKSVSVQINLELIDRISNVVMTGFGAIPRRGAEVGGILVGSIDGRVVRIDEFEPVPCSYKRGPSYFLSDADQSSFMEAWEKWKPGPGKSQYAVGYYRSNTRDQTTLASEDHALCAQYFPPPSNVVLFIKPYATKVSQAGFITYEKGVLEDQSALEFPFRRYDLDGGAPPPARRPLGEEREGRGESRRGRQPRIPAEPRYEPQPLPQAEPQYAQQEFERPYAVTTESRSSRNKGWMWIPLSFIFLLLGVLLGFQAALTMYPKAGSNATSTGDDSFALGLEVTQTDDNLHVKWNRDAGAIKAAARGVLFIADGEYRKKVELDTTQLQNGSIIYRKLSSHVAFRVEVYPKDHVTISETADWKQ